MSRKLLTGALVGALLLSVLGLRARPALSAGSPEAGRAALRRVVARLPRYHAPAAASGPTIAAAGYPGPTYVLAGDAVLFLDHDQDGETTFGDVFVLNGPLIHANTGRTAGTWEGTLTITNAETFHASLTLLFPNSGTVTIQGSPYGDGARSDVFLAPIVGATGFVRNRGLAGFFNNETGDLLVWLGAR